MGGSGEKLMGPLLFVATFIAVSAVFISLLGELVTHNEMNVGGPEGPTPQQLLLENYNLIAYDPTVVAANGSALGPGTNHWQQIDFKSPGRTNVGCLIMRNFTWRADLVGWPSQSTAKRALQNYQHDVFGGSGSGREFHDFVFFWQSWPSGTLNLEQYIRYYMLPFGGILAQSHPQAGWLTNMSTDLNVSTTNFHMRYWATSIISWMEPNISSSPTPGYQLYNNRFNITLGVGINATLGNANPWSLLGQIVTLKLPDTPPIIGFLMAVPIYFICGYAVVVIIIWAFSL
jgi:hypothetical protein